MTYTDRFIIFFIFLVLLCFSLLFVSTTDKTSSADSQTFQEYRREIASLSPSVLVDNKNCFQLASSLFEGRPDSLSSGVYSQVMNTLSTKKRSLSERIAKKTSRFNPFSRTNHNYSPDWESFSRMRETYIEQIESSPESFFRSLEQGRLFDNSQAASPEEVLAIIHAINFSSTGKRFFANSQQEQLLRELSYLMENKRQWDIFDLQSFSARWQRTTFFGQTDPVESLLPSADRVISGLRPEDRFLYKTLNQDLITKGLEKTLDNYGLFRHRPNLYKRFTNSITGKALASGFFNLPVLYGMPPLYLPGGRSLRVPDHLSKRLVSEGFSRGLADEIVTHWRLSGPIWNLSSRQKYEMLRRYYGVAATSYVSYMIYQDYHEQQEEILEQREFIQDTSTEMTNLLDSANELERRGYQIFEDSDESSVKEESASLNDESSYCQTIRSCFEMIKEEEGQFPRPGDDNYLMCKEFMDPDNHCEKY